MKVLLAVFLAGIVFTSGGLSAQTNNPVPFVRQPLIPSAVAPGGAGFTLTVNGAGFVSGASVNWNGSPRDTTFVSGTQLTASILSSDIATAATASVTVVNPAPGGGASNIVFLPVTNPTSFVSLNQTSFGTEQPTFQVAVGDFNKDGKQDLAFCTTTTQGMRTLLVMLGDGDGTFGQGTTFNMQCLYVDSADVNNDGNPDVVVITTNSQGSATPAVMLGNGDGTFQAPILLPQSECCQLVIADFNRDGAVDVLVPNGGEYCLFLGKGDGTFNSPTCVVLPPPGGFYFAVTDDFNGDGKLDVALTGSNLAVLLGNGDGTFGSAQTYSINGGFGPGISAADLNGDGRADLVIANNAINAAVVFLNNGDGTFSNGSNVPTALGPEAVSIADLNGDGKLDLAVGDDGLGFATVSVLLGNGDGTFQNYTAFDGIGVILDLADFNDDGRLDLAVTGAPSPMFAILLQDSGTVVSLSSQKLNFPLQMVNTVSPSKLVALTNTGSSTVTVSSVATSANFSEINRCHTVHPGQKCDIAVYFTPTTTGTLGGYLAINDDGGGSPQLVSLSGVATVVSLNPTSLDFGSWKIHSFSKPQNVIVTNQGNASIKLSQVSIGGQNGSNFSEVNACPASLPAGASCTISVLFHPSATGTRNATLAIVDTGGGSPQKVGLTGTGTSTSAP